MDIIKKNYLWNSCIDDVARLILLQFDYEELMAILEDEPYLSSIINADFWNQKVINKLQVPLKFSNMMSITNFMKDYDIQLHEKRIGNFGRNDKDMEEHINDESQHDILRNIIHQKLYNLFMLSCEFGNINYINALFNIYPQLSNSKNVMYGLLGKLNQLYIGESHIKTVLNLIKDRYKWYPKYLAENYVGYIEESSPDALNFIISYVGPEFRYSQIERAKMSKHIKCFSAILNALELYDIKGLKLWISFVFMKVAGPEDGYPDSLPFLLNNDKFVKHLELTDSVYEYIIDHVDERYAPLISKTRILTNGSTDTYVPQSEHEANKWIKFGFDPNTIIRPIRKEIKVTDRRIINMFFRLFSTGDLDTFLAKFPSGNDVDSIQDNITKDWNKINGYDILQKFYFVLNDCYYPSKSNIKELFANDALKQAIINKAKSFKLMQIYYSVSVNDGFNSDGEKYYGTINSAWHAISIYSKRQYGGQSRRMSITSSISECDLYGEIDNSNEECTDDEYIDDTDKCELSKVENNLTPISKIVRANESARISTVPNVGKYILEVTGKRELKRVDDDPTTISKILRTAGKCAAKEESSRSDMNSSKNDESARIDRIRRPSKYILEDIDSSSSSEESIEDLNINIKHMK